MYIILRLICELLSRISVKISFPYGGKHDVYPTALFEAGITPRYLRNNVQNFTSVILYMNFSDYLVHVLILTFYTVPVCLYNVKTRFKAWNISSKHVSDFLLWKYDVISQLCHSYAKGPFCMTWLMLFPF